MGTNPEPDDERERIRSALAEALGRAAKRLARRIAAVNQDLARIAEASATSEQAAWLLAEAARAPRGARVLRVTDWSSGEARPLEFPLDPSKPALGQVEAVFKRAKRLRGGEAVARARLRQAEEEHARVATLRARTESAETEEELAAIVGEATSLRIPVPLASAADAPRRGMGGKAVRKQERLPYRAFQSGSGARILVGRGAADNDALTFRVARPYHLWMHAREHTGAHVVVPLPKGRTCPSDLLVDAAHLAAHFSSARGEPVVEIAYAARGHVRKPRGAPPGLVVVDREKVLSLRLEPARLARLLAAEEPSASGG